MSEQATITLAGRKFRGLGHDITVAQHLYICAQLKKADAFPIVQRINSENFERCAQELLLNIMERGITYKLMSGLLTEVGKTWNQVEADRNAQTFADSRDWAEGLVMQAEVVRFLANFMQSARPSSKSSPRSSSPAGADPSTTSAGSTNSGNLP